MYRKKSKTIKTALPKKNHLLGKISQLIFLVIFFFAPTLIILTPVSASAFFSPGVQANCALPLYLAALQQGRASQGSNKENLRGQERYFIKRIETLDKAIDDIESNIRSAKEKIGKGIGDYGERRGHVVDQIHEYMKKGWNPDQAEETYCYNPSSYYSGNQRSLYIASYFEAVRPPFSFEFLQTITKKSFSVLVPDAGAAVAVQADPSCVVDHAAKRGNSGKCYCINGYEKGGFEDFLASATGVVCVPPAAAAAAADADADAGAGAAPPAPADPCDGYTGGAVEDGSCVCNGGTFSTRNICVPTPTPAAAADAAAADAAAADAAAAAAAAADAAAAAAAAADAAAADAAAADAAAAAAAAADAAAADAAAADAAAADAAAADAAAAAAAAADAAAADAAAAAAAAAADAAAADAAAADAAAADAAAADAAAAAAAAAAADAAALLPPSLDCEHWKRWKECAEEDSKGKITDALCRHAQSCARGGTILRRDDVPVFPEFYPGTTTRHSNASQPEYRPVRSDVCQKALKSLEDLIKRLKEEKAKRKRFADLLRAAGQTLEDIEYAEITGTTEAQNCATCDLERLKDIKEIIDPAPSGWDVLGNVIGTVGSAALGYYGIKEANKLRDRQGFAAQPGYALGLAYPFIMKGLYGGGLFGGSSSSMACSPTAGTMGGNVFGNPYLMQQMQQAQQMQYMQQMYLMQAFYSSMPGQMGGGMMPGMMGGGMMPGMMGGGMMPGGNVGFIAGGMMPGMMGGGMMPGGNVGFIAGGMMPGMMGGGMMGGGMMPGMMGGGMMPGMMGGGMMPGMMGGGMMPGGGMAGMQAYMQYQQAMMSYKQAQMNNYMQRQQAASGLYTEINRLQMQIYQLYYGGGGAGINVNVGGGGRDDSNNSDTSVGGGGSDDDDDYDVIRGI